MIHLIGVEKGGTGKTTLATNLAAWLKNKGSDVLILDTDKQGSASFWCSEREGLEKPKKYPYIPCTQKFGNTLHSTIKDLSGKYDDIVIDAGGKDSVELRAALTVADTVTLPLQASQFDIWTLVSTDKILEQARAINPKLRSKVVITRASTNPSVSEAEEAIALFEDMQHAELAKTIIKERIAYRKAARCGLAVFEMDNVDSKASHEIEDLFKEITNEE